MGFAGPVGSWCKENGLVSLVAERFRQSSTSASEILDSTAVLDFLEHINLDSISNREANQVWTLLCLEIWVQIFIENIDPEKIDCKEESNDKPFSCNVCTIKFTQHTFMINHRLVQLNGT